MELFEYKALDAKGQQKKGTLQGDSAKGVRSALRAQGLIPVSVQVLKGQQDQSATKSTISDTRIKLGDLAIITRELGALLKAGLEVEQSLASVALSCENKKLKTLLEAVHVRIMEGFALYQGLNQFPKAFPHVYRASVQAGEEAGYLGEVLSHLATYLENQQKMRQKVLQIMIYPSVLTVVALGIIMFLLIFVAPKILVIYQDTDTQLPWMTLVLIQISDFLGAWWWALLAAIVITGVTFKALLKRAEFRYKVDKLLIRLPILGKLIRLIQTGRFLRTLSLLTRANVPILQAMKVSAELVAIMPIKNTLAQAKDHVKDGASIHKALKQTGYFSSTSLQFVASGEATGDLQEMLMHAAENQERHVQFAMDTFLSLFEPLLILLMGVFVLFIVLAMLLPMFQLSTMV